MPFAKGHSGNPGGRSTEKAFENALRAAVNAEDPKTKRRKLQMIAESVVTAATAGESWAVNIVADRLDGKPAQSMDMTVRRLGAKELTDDDLADIAAGGSDGAADAPDNPPILN
jgi:hypothetical protein